MAWTHYEQIFNRVILARIPMPFFSMKFQIFALKWLGLGLELGLGLGLVLGLGLGLEFRIKPQKTHFE